MPSSGVTGCGAAGIDPDLCAAGFAAKVRAGGLRCQERRKEQCQHHITSVPYTLYRPISDAIALTTPDPRSGRSNFACLAVRKWLREHRQFAGVNTFILRKGIDRKNSRQPSTHMITKLIEPVDT